MKTKEKQPEMVKIESLFKANDEVLVIHDAWTQTKCEHCEKYSDVKEYKLEKGRIEWVDARQNWTWGRATVHYRVRVYNKRGSYKKESVFAGVEDIFTENCRAAAEKELKKRQKVLAAHIKKAKR